VPYSAALAIPASSNTDNAAPVNAVLFIITEVYREPGGWIAAAC
jgi:hypothetical protein